jgi:two-component system CheB/CheR fusion protein
MPNEEHGPESPPDKPDQPSGDGSLIAVGVGASAGGLEAFTELLRHLPSSTGMSIMLVQHLDPHHESALPELLSSRTRMPVVQVQNDTAIQPDHVYVIPPNTAMRVRNRRLMLDARPTTIERFRPIDTFFNSLAEEFRFNAVGIVLSGTASDGTLGLKTIKAEGGITFAQNQTARFDSMPRSAIAAGVVDFILPPRRIAEELVAIADWGRHLNRTEGDFHEDATTLNRVLLLLRSNTGVDFTQYKQPTIRRRLNRRMAVRKAESLQQYFNLLKEDGAEAKALFDDLLINVTDFFRDPDVFEAAKKIAFPALIRDRKQPRLIRAWIPGCSSGEEVYSIAIALSEFFEAEDLDVNAQIFGTDVSDSAIDRARAGIFSDSAVAGVSPERLRRYFVRADSGYQISRNIREMCIFSRHDVARDTPLSRMDLISCRNLLIYFSPALQRRIVATFVYALQPGGCLILGPSETVGGMSDYFTGLDEKHKIYCRKGNALEAFANLTEGIEETEPKPAVPPAAPRPAEPLPSASGRLHNYVNQIVLSRFGPAGVVVNESLRMTEYRGEMAPYLHAAETHPDVDLMEVVRPELRASISTAIEQARRTGLAVVAETTAIQSAEGLRSVDVTVFPLSLPGMPQHFLILFGQAGEQEGAELTVPVESEGESAAAASLTAAEENAQLKQELRATREYLQSVIEELRSANEEAQSSNEELQSTMEEMQTSKEELQAANEELNTINSEMQSRNAELAQINDDLINLLASMNMPIVMTGIDLRIRRFTPIAPRITALTAPFCSCSTSAISSAAWRK